MFSFRKEFSKTLCKYINLESPNHRTVSLAISAPCSILVDNTYYILVDTDCTVLFRRIQIRSSPTVILIFQN